VVVDEGPVDALESLTALVRRLEGVHRAQPDNGVIARELRMALGLLAELSADRGDDPLDELRRMIRDSDLTER
jgi:hypothetical protein